MGCGSREPHTARKTEWGVSSQSIPGIQSPRLPAEPEATSIKMGYICYRSPCATSVPLRRTQSKQDLHSVQGGSNVDCESCLCCFDLRPARGNRIFECRYGSYFCRAPRAQPDCQCLRRVRGLIDAQDRCSRTDVAGLGRLNHSRRTDRSEDPGTRDARDSPCSAGSGSRHYGYRVIGCLAQRLACPVLTGTAAFNKTGKHELRELATAPRLLANGQVLARAAGPARISVRQFSPAPNSKPDHYSQRELIPIGVIEGFNRGIETLLTPD